VAGKWYLGLVPVAQPHMRKEKRIKGAVKKLRPKKEKTGTKRGTRNKVSVVRSPYSVGAAIGNGWG